jgi:hypothetical protein
MNRVSPAYPATLRCAQSTVYSLPFLRMPGTFFLLPPLLGTIRIVTSSLMLYLRAKRAGRKR